MAPIFTGFRFGFGRVAQDLRTQAEAKFQEAQAALFAL
jgi:hypothetical protein